MPRLLRTQDYLRTVQTDNLLQIIESNYQILIDVEQAAQAEMISYLVQRYETSEVFSDTKVFDITAIYKGKQLVEWTAPIYNIATTYLANDYTVEGGFIYKSIAGNIPHAFNASEWTKITEDKTLYYVPLPYPEWSKDIEYNIGDIVYYKNVEYTATYKNIGFAPSSSQFWNVGSAYRITGQYPDNSLLWAKGDNRNQQIVMHLMDMTLYHLHSRINPRNVPDIRKERYDGNTPTQSGGAIAFLKRCASGDVTLDVPQKLPQQGMSIRYGSAVPKQTNTY